MKKAISILMVVLMLTGLTVPAQAATTGETIIDIADPHPEVFESFGLESFAMLPGSPSEIIAFAEALAQCPVALSNLIWNINMVGRAKNYNIVQSDFIRETQAYHGLRGLDKNNDPITHTIHNSGKTIISKIKEISANGGISFSFTKDELKDYDHNNRGAGYGYGIKTGAPLYKGFSFAFNGRTHDEKYPSPFDVDSTIEIHGPSDADAWNAIGDCSISKISGNYNDARKGWDITVVFKDLYDWHPDSDYYQTGDTLNKANGLYPFQNIPYPELQIIGDTPSVYIGLIPYDVTYTVEDYINGYAPKETSKSKDITSTPLLKWPVPGYGSISSPYGQRGSSFHYAIDIPAPEGASIVAAAGGTVVAVYTGAKRYDPSGGWGNYVKIQHTPTLYTLYAHCSSIPVKVGQTVKGGQTIAQIGVTGNTTGPHTHFEVYHGGPGLANRVNPIPYLTGRGHASLTPIGDTSGEPAVVWPDPLGDPNPLDFYLVPQDGKNPKTSDGKWSITFNAWNGAKAYKSQPWIDNLVDTGSKATFDILPNNTDTARDGSVRAVLGDHLVECIRYLECAPVQTYNATIPAYGGSATITLPNGYQYYQYGTLECSSKPDWIDTPYFSQTASSAAPTITISADHTSVARNGTIVVTMGNSRDGTYEIAKINVSQSAVTGSVTPAQPVTRAATTDFVLVPAAGGNDYENSHVAYINATIEFSKDWFINLRNTSSKAIFDIAGNTGTNARDGSVRTLSNGTVVQQMRYLQCGQQEEYIYNTVNPNGETINITLPSNYQYIEYGQLTCGPRPDWITSVSFTQNATVMPGTDNRATAKITVGKADISRSGTFTLMMGNTSTNQGNKNTSYAIATVAVTQTVTTPASISVSPSLLTIETGESYGLEAILTPPEVQNRMVSWSSSNPGVATVSGDGEITGVSPGTANITATTANGLTAVCNVTVTEPYAPVEAETDHLQFDASANVGDDAWVLSVENGGDYTITADEWLNYDIDGSELRVTCDKNTDDENRYGAVTIEAENGSSAVVTVKQVGTSFEPAEKEQLHEVLLEVAGSEIDLEQTNSKSYETLVYAFYTGIMAYEDTYAEQDVTDAITESIYDAMDDVTFIDNTVPIELETENHFAYIIGYDDSTVRPENDITRAETTAIVFRLLKDSARGNYWSNTNTFTDVDSGKWYNNAVSTMTNAGIIKGYPDNTFGGDKNITRAEFAVILARFNSDTYTGENKFTDIDGHWAIEYINRAAEKGWVDGYTGNDTGKFKPDQNITRAEAMTVINRVLGRASIDEMHGDMTTWKDNSDTKWYYKAVQEATNSHEYERDANGFEHWTKVVPAPDWVNLERSWSPTTE